MTKVLSVKQPWAWAIFHAGKDVENRGWTTRHRGTLLIHATLSPDPDAPAFFRKLGIAIPPGLPLGQILGSITITDVITGSNSRWADPGAKHWLLADPELWAVPVKASGQVTLWDWPRNSGGPAEVPGGALEPAEETALLWRI